MSDFRPSPQGILKCRDLVWLYFGLPMVTSLVENEFNPTGVDTQIMKPDPRRISYEIILTNSSAARHFANLASTRDILDTVPQLYFVPPGDSIIIKRDFFTDLDAVTLPVWANTDSGTVTVSTRETFLTPNAVSDGS